MSSNAEVGPECVKDCAQKCGIGIALRAAEDAMYTDPRVDQGVKDMYAASRGIVSRRIFDSISKDCEGTVDGECPRAPAFNAAHEMYAGEIRTEIAKTEQGCGVLIKFTSLGKFGMDYSIAEDVERNPNLARAIIEVIASKTGLEFISDDGEAGYTSEDSADRQ